MKFKLILGKPANKSLGMRTRCRKKKGGRGDTEAKLAVQGKKEAHSKFLQTKTQGHINAANAAKAKRAVKVAHRHSCEH
jgi:hypothetical protein